MADEARKTGPAGLLAAALIPPAAAAGLGSSFVAHHLVLAVAIGLGYGVIVVIAGFWAHVADDLFTLWRQPIVARLDRSVRQQERRYEERYLEVTLAGLKEVDQKDLRIVGEFAPSLDAVFRRVALVPRPPQHIKSGVLLDLASEQAERPDLGDLLGRAEPQVLAVVGPPGSGKTTLLRHAARSRNDFVVTSRPLGYQSARVESARIVQPSGFTAGQVTRFVSDWYREFEVHSPGAGAAKGGFSTLESRDERARERAENLLRDLVDTPALYDLAVNPLLLTMIANLHRHRNRHGESLPRTRGSLYFEICEVMLGRRQKFKGIAQALSTENKKAILARVAYVMMDRRVSDLSRADVLAVIRPVLRRAPEDVSPDDFLTEARSDGLLIEAGNDRYAFAHKTFQEYLAATHIHKKRNVGKLSGAVNDDWWTEVTLFYAEQADDAAPIIEACLAANTVSALALALECADQCRDLDPELKARLTAVREITTKPDELDSSAADLRRLASILLSMHLRRRSRTGADSQVCVRPVPAEIYRLFLADTRTGGPDADPASLEAVADIAAGVRADDAVAFVTWANAIRGGQATYRLPRAAEVADLAARQRISALPSGVLPKVWALPDDGPSGTPQLWQLTPDAPAPRQRDEVSLTAAIEDDLTSPVPLLGSLLLLRARLMAQLPQLLLATYDYPRGGILDPLDATAEADPDPALTAVLAPAPELALALGLDQAPVGAPPFDADLSFTLSQAQAKEIDFDDALKDAREFDVDLARLIGTAGADGLDTDALASRVIRQGPLDERTQPLLQSLTRLATGEALSWALARARRAAAESKSPVRPFAQAFATAAGVAATSLPGNPDLLPETLRRALQLLKDALAGKPGAPGSASWASVVAERLERNAESVLSRAERPARETSTAIRLAALCLAAEADDLRRKEIGDMFREVAVGITWLQKRACGELPATEVIMLAAE